MTEYDAIVVGARVAGSPTAMLLARKGYRVLLVDRSTFPSDIMSTHVIHPRGMDALHRWGLSDRLVATGCPPVTRYRLDFGPIAIVGAPRGFPGADHAYAPRRIVLDNLLVEAAAQAGAQVREGFSVDSLVVEDGIVRGIRGRTKGGTEVVDHARVVIGADGVHSFVAEQTGASKYVVVPPTQAMYYSYWSGMPTDGEFQTYVRDDRAFVTVPTHDDLTVVLVGWPIDQFETNKADLESAYLRSFDRDDAFAQRVRSATRESRLVGTRMENFYRQSYGPGWALVGDAGYHKDANTAQGISDAFAEAESLADAMDDVFAERRTLDDALRAYQEGRDERTMPMFELTCQFASYEPPSEEDQALFGALAGNRDAMDDFMSMFAGSMPVQTFFDPANVGRYFEAAAANASS
ncbi:MAG: NAD(P)/FAD-dependent oxidoreductase [Actinomycetota bacterium]